MHDSTMYSVILFLKTTLQKQHFVSPVCTACTESTRNVQNQLGYWEEQVLVHVIKLGLHVRRKHKHKHKQPTCKPVRRKHKRLVLAPVLMLASSRFTRTTQRHKHKHKHKRMELLPFSCACAYACVVASYVYTEITQA